MVKYWISHRGNINDKLPMEENKPQYVLNALDKGFDVVIDVWVVDNKIFLGNEEPLYQINIDFLKNPLLWCRAKNFDALILLNNNRNYIHSFSHDKDDYV